MARLSRSRTRALRRERKRLLLELAELSLLVRGSYLERFSTCSRPGCTCHQGRRHGPRAYLAVTRNKVQRQVYVPQGQVEAVRAGVKQYHRLLELAQRISTINLELMRGGELNVSVQ